MTLQMQIILQLAIEGSKPAIEGSVPGERPPHTQSLWVSADGYFYALYITPADVSHKSFKTPTMVLKAAV